MEKVYSHAQVNLEHREEDRQPVIGYNCASISGTWDCHETLRAAGDAFTPSHGIMPEIHCPHVEIPDRELVTRDKTQGNGDKGVFVVSQRSHTAGHRSSQV